MLGIEGISKAFGSVQANDDVSVRLDPGQIIGLLGENGAGKSTLLSIVSGYLRPDAGTVTVDGAPLRFGSPRRAIALGIGLVHQHLSVIPEFTVREQLALAGYRKPAMPSLVASLAPETSIADLALGQRQRLEIARAMVSQPRVLLLDEPTSILTPAEVEDLFTILRELRDVGTTVVLVTHKLREILPIADRMIVMAKGMLVGDISRNEQGNWPPDTETAVLRQMFRDREVPTPNPSAPADRSHLQPAASMLELIDVTPVTGNAAQSVSASFASGGLYTVAGIDGEGQRQLARAIMGLDGHTGTVLLDGTEISALSALERSRLGMTILSDDKRGEGAIPAFSLTENMLLNRAQRPSFRKHGLLRWASAGNSAATVIADWNVHPNDPDARFGTLSGGNMQRFLAGTQLISAPRVVVALNPVQGLDARTAAFLWQRFREVCDGGGTVIAFLSDLDEAIQHGDQVGVMRAGRLSPFTNPTVTTRSEFASMMVNGW